jgi:hypothetical protein
MLRTYTGRAHYWNVSRIARLGGLRNRYASNGYF